MSSAAKAEYQEVAIPGPPAHSTKASLLRVTSQSYNINGVHKSKDKHPHAGAIPQHKRGLFYRPLKKCPTSAAMLCVMPIQRRIICRLILREELITGESSFRALPKTTKFLHAY
jgi:hypothetical protein